MKHSKLLSVAATLLLLVSLFTCCCSSVNVVNAQDVFVIDSISLGGSTSGAQINTGDPVGSGMYSALGQSFTGNGFNVSLAEFYLRRTATVSSVDVWFVAEIYAMSGGVPTGDVLAVSSPVLFNRFPTVTDAVAFVFDDGFVVDDGVSYFVSVRCVSAGLGGADTPPYAFVSTVTSSSVGAAFRLGSAGWVAIASRVAFSLYGFDDSVVVVVPSVSSSVPVDVGLGGDVSGWVLFVLFALVVFMVFLLALSRGSIGFYALSCGLWLLFGFALQVFGEPGDGFVLGFTIVSFLLSLIMAVLMFMEIVKMVNGRRNVEESVFG